MKHLFKDDDRESYTEEALDIEAELRKAITPIVKKYREMGYCARDLQYLCQGVGFDVCLDLIMDAIYPVTKTDKP